MSSTTRTRSERLFEEFCSRKRIRFRRVAASKARTPDYDVFLPRRKVVVEVKEFTPNPQEVRAAEELRRNKFSAVTMTPGDRVRKKITQAAPQIRSRCRGRFPGLLVLFDDGVAARHVDSYQIRVAMYGLEQIVLVVPTDPRVSAYPIDRKYGPKRKMTADHNTSISALAVLTERPAGDLELIVYHNDHAAVPLPESLLARYAVPQNRLDRPRRGTIADWVEVKRRGMRSNPTVETDARNSSARGSP
jgi:hypothetical protein